MAENKTKLKIIEAGKKLFWKRGFIDVSISQIIEESSTNRGSYYHYFANKTALAKEINYKLHEDISKQIQKIFPQNDRFQTFFLMYTVVWHISCNVEEIIRYDKDFFGQYADGDLPFEDIILALSPCKNFSYTEMLMIQAAGKAIMQDFLGYCNKNIEKFNERELNYFASRLLHSLYKTPSEIVDKYIDASYFQLEKLDIAMNNFDITITEKEQ